jgi:hypothetical protein
VSATGEIMRGVSLLTCPYQHREPAILHSAYGLHLNNVIAKRLGISAGD